VIQYIYARYGRTRAAMVANVISFQKKGALRAVGKALGFSDVTLGAVQRIFVDRFSHSLPMRDVLAQAVPSPHVSSDMNSEVDFGRNLDAWARFARTLVGFPRHLGVHSGGFVLSHEPLADIVPVEPATMEGRSVIQWNKDDIEALGLFKVDVLALGMLTALRKTFSMLHAHGVCLPGREAGVPVRLDTLPPDCPKTYAMIRKADTTGVFQIESRAQMSMLPRLLPRVFYDLVIEVAIVRPGPIVGNMVHPYLKRRQGDEPVDYPDVRLRPILEKTLGVPIFQEQVMRIAVAVGNFTPGEADELRRSMGAWKFKGTVSKFEEKLLTGMRDNGIPDAFAQGILGQIQGFSEYGFPESHAVSFALLAYASSYLKAHFPVYFLCGLLNSQPMGFYSVHSLLQESRHKGHTHLPPCIASSTWDSFVVPPQAESSKAAPQTTLRLGLGLVSGVSAGNGEAFVKRRSRLAKSAGYEEHLALLQECFTSREQVSLVMGGVFHIFEPERRTVLWHVLARPSALRPDTDARRFLPKPSLLEAWDVLRDDYKHLRTSLGPHAVFLVKKLAWPFEVPVHALTLAKDLVKESKGREEFVTVMGLAIVRQMPPTAKGMMFITLEDETGSMNLVLQPQVSTRDRAHLVSSDLLCVTAKKQRNGTACTLLVTRVHAPRLVARSQEAGSVVAPLVKKANVVG
jgi:error-prone DNA polymerase